MNIKINGSDENKKQKFPEKKIWINVQIDGPSLISYAFLIQKILIVSQKIQRTK